jgi:hypothetical protein
MARLSLNVNELHVESFDSGSVGEGLHGARGANDTRAGCPPTAYITCFYSTPRQDEYRLTSLCC